MSNRRKPTYDQLAERPWYYDPNRNLTDVEHLQPGAVITGTGASGAYEDGPRTFTGKTISPRDSIRTTAYTLHFADGSTCVYYADTVVEVAA